MVFRQRRARYVQQHKQEELARGSECDMFVCCCMIGGPSPAKAAKPVAAVADSAAASNKDKKSVSIAPGTVDNQKPPTDKAAAAATATGAATNSTLTTDEEEFSTANCRMYESKYPEADDLVIVQVKNVAEMGAYVSLLEYNGIEGMILLSELSRRYEMR